MVCGMSKVDDTDLVSLCRNRKELIKAAVDSRYALALAHVKYFQSLSSVGNALQNFVEESVVASVDSTTITGSDHGALDEGSELGTSSWDSETDVISLTDYVHEGSESSEPSSLTVESRSEGSLCIDHCKKCSEEVSTRVYKQSQVVSGPNSVMNRPHHGNSGQFVNLPPNGSRLDQYGYDLPNSHWSSLGGIGVSYGASVNMHPSSLTSGQYDCGMSFSDPVNLPSELPRFLQHGSGIFPGGRLYLAPNSPWCMCFPTDFLPNGPRFPLYENGVSYSFPVKMPANDPYFNQALKFRAAPPCPPPPEVSTWDSLNPFRYFDDNFLGYYYQECCGTGFGSANGPDFEEVNESEGFSVLEDEIEQNLMEESSHETVLGIIDKEGSGEGPSKVAQKDAMKSRHEGCMSSEKENVTSVNDTLKNEMKRNKDSFASKGLVEDKKKNLGTCEIQEGLALDGASLRRPRQVTPTTLPHGSRSYREALEEIKDAFETAFNHGKELSIALEAGKLPYQPTVLYSRILKFLVPPIVISSPWKHMTPKRLASRRAKMSKISSLILERDTMNSGNLTSTLDKLYAWEKKLYKEVKDEEKLRVIYVKDCKKLKKIENRGAEFSKIDTTQASIRRLLPRINVAVSSVTSISRRIHKLTDEELGAQLNELLHRFIAMWTLMIECHRKQFQVILEAKVQVQMTETGKRSSSLKAAQNLELQILKWGSSFTEWINTQKVFVKNLNRWLMRCLLQEPGETEDGNAFFSSSRQGTPSIFIICNDWYCSIEKISGDGVLESIHDFASMLRQLWEKLNEEKHQRLKAEYLSRDLEKRRQSLRNRSHVNCDQCVLLNNSGTSGSTDTGAAFPDKVLEDLKSIRDRLNEANKKHEELIKEVDDSVCHCFQGGLVPIFEALWRFSSDMTEAYKGVSFPVQGSTDCAL